MPSSRRRGRPGQSVYEVCNRLVTQTQPEESGVAVSAVPVRLERQPRRPGVLLRPGRLAAARARAAGDLRGRGLLASVAHRAVAAVPRAVRADLSDRRGGPQRRVDANVCGRIAGPGGDPFRQRTGGVGLGHLRGGGGGRLSVVPGGLPVHGPHGAARTSPTAAGPISTRPSRRGTRNCSTPSRRCGARWRGSRSRLPAVTLAAVMNIAFLAVQAAGWPETGP